MATTQAELDAALDAVEAAVQKLGTDMLQAFADLNAKIAAGATDLTPELNKAQAMAQELATFDADAVAADPGPTP